MSPGGIRTPRTTRKPHIHSKEQRSMTIRLWLFYKIGELLKCILLVSRHVVFCLGSRQHSLGLEHVLYSFLHNSPSSVAVPSALV